MQHTIDDVGLLKFNQIGDDRGHLVIIEGKVDKVPFDIKRVFYIYGSDTEVVRGQHANRETEFVLINVCGKSKVRIDDGVKEKIIELDKPHIGLYLPTMIWKDMYDFSKDSILLVLASEHYNSEEYIRDYEEFKKEIKNNE